MKFLIHKEGQGYNKKEITFGFLFTSIGFRGIFLCRPYKTETKLVRLDLVRHKFKNLTFSNQIILEN